MTLETTYTKPEFGSMENLQSSINKIRLQAQAQNLNGFVVRDDFLPTLGDYRRKETVLWQLINKVYARAATVKEMLHTARPVVEFTNRSALGDSPENPIGTLDKDLSDPGQDLKALAGKIDVDNFGRSLYEQQGRPYFEQISMYTDDMITQAMRILEFALIDGDATANNGYQFNGFTRQMAPNHTFTATKIGSSPDQINDKLDEIVMRASTDVNVLRKITHIVCSGAGYRQLQKELKELQQWHNMVTITPGVNVPSIVTAIGSIPIITSPYIKDTPANTGNGTPERVNYWLIDITQLEWHGLVPYGGQRTLEPQIFDVRNIINGKPLLDKRFLLSYGTLYCKNRGQGIYKLEVDVPDGSIWNQE